VSLYMDDGNMGVQRQPQVVWMTRKEGAGKLSEKHVAFIELL
jgi:hypothetical protein